MLQAAVVQHRQVEAAAVPAHELRDVLLQRVEEGLDDAALALAVAVGEGVHAQAVGVAEHAADDEDALQVQGHEIGLPVGRALGFPGRVDLGVALRVVGAAQQAQAGHVGDGFDVEDEDR